MQRVGDRPIVADEFRAIVRPRSLHSPSLPVLLLAVAISNTLPASPRLFVTSSIPSRLPPSSPCPPSYSRLATVRHGLHSIGGFTGLALTVLARVSPMSESYHPVASRDTIVCTPARVEVGQMIVSA